MRKHNGMRPHDVVILLAIITKKDANWMIKDLAADLYISQSEVSESINRSKVARLLSWKSRILNRTAFFKFLQTGLPYVFPVHPGRLVEGTLTAHSHPAIKKRISSSGFYVWPEIGGRYHGYAIEPLYEKQVLAVKKNAELYKLLAMVDTIRLDRTQEQKIAIEILEESILHND